jgi:hypothetical protein
MTARVATSADIGLVADIMTFAFATSACGIFSSRRLAASCAISARRSRAAARMPGKAGLAAVRSLGRERRGSLRLPLR